MRRHRVCIATGTRADWGLLRPVADLLRGRTDLQLLVTNMHLSERFGHTVDEIVEDGYKADWCVPLPDGTDDSAEARAESMGQCVVGTARALGEMKPELMIILGDRYEMLGVASAAMMMGVPIAHIAGGEVTLGAIDDTIRNAITKMSSLHLTTTEAYRERVISMGEPAEMVHNVGALGVWNALHTPLMSTEEIRRELGIEQGRRFAVVTYHPVTRGVEDPCVAFGELLGAMEEFPELHLVITYPNNDARSLGLIRMIEDYSRVHRGVTAVKSLGMRRYLSAVRAASVVVGNSSSGVVEVPSTGTPTVDVGDRQMGRIAARSVIHCGESRGEITEAVRIALRGEGRERVENPYYKADTPELIVEQIIKFLR